MAARSAVFLPRRQTRQGGIARANEYVSHHFCRYPHLVERP
jgi:hypothetical protein